MSVGDGGGLVNSISSKGSLSWDFIFIECVSKRERRELERELRDEGRYQIKSPIRNNALCHSTALGPSLGPSVAIPYI